MLVCPNCRNENLEDANFCRVCGRSLEPMGSPMRRLEPTGRLEPEEELPKGRGVSPWPTVILLLVIGAGLGAWGLVSALRPAPTAPCAGRVASPQYPYCTGPLEQWQRSIGFNGGQLVDQFLHQSQSALTVVTVDEILVQNQSTAQYAQQFRTSLKVGGINPTRTSVVRLDGEPAATWDYVVPPQGQEPPIAVRDVILVRPEGAYRIQFQAEENVRLEALIDFHALLRTWRWRS
ncbi:MAG: zinc-ribbon domain-containing protein [Actinomycetota bacterium]